MPADQSVLFAQWRYDAERAAARDDGPTKPASVASATEDVEALKKALRTMKDAGATVVIPSDADVVLLTADQTEKE